MANDYDYTSVRVIWSDTALSCAWCGVYLGDASNATYLNGNLPVCDLCLMKARNLTYSIEDKPTP